MLLTVGVFRELWEETIAALFQAECLSLPQEPSAVLCAVQAESKPGSLPPTGAQHSSLKEEGRLLVNPEAR